MAAEAAISNRIQKSEGDMSTAGDSMMTPMTGLGVVPMVLSRRPVANVPRHIFTPSERADHLHGRPCGNHGELDRGSNVVFGV